MHRATGRWIPRTLAVCVALVGALTWVGSASADVLLTADPADPVVGQPVTVTANLTDATALSWAWTFDGVSQPLVVGDTFVTPALTAGPHQVEVNVLTATPGLETGELPINPLDAGSIQATPAAPTEGQDVTLTGNASGGSGTLAYHWTVDGGALATTASTTTVSALPAGSHDVGLTVTDDLGTSASAPGFELVVAAAPVTTTTQTTDTPPPSTGSSGDGAAQTPIGSFTSGEATTGTVTTTTTSSAKSSSKSSSKPKTKTTTTKAKTTKTKKKATPALISPFPRVRYAGVLTVGGARLKTFTVKAPKSARIRVVCKHGCPRSKLAMVARNVPLKKMLGWYEAGAVLEISVTRPHRIGKFTRVTFAKGKPPGRIDRCLWPGSTKPRLCPKQAKTARAASS